MTKVNNPTSYMYIDQNLNQALFRTENRYKGNLEKFWKQVSDLGLNDESNRESIPTAFSFLERIGLKINVQKYQKVKIQDSLVGQIVSSQNKIKCLDIKAKKTIVSKDKVKFIQERSMESKNKIQLLYECYKHLEFKFKKIINKEKMNKEKKFTMRYIIKLLEEQKSKGVNDYYYKTFNKKNLSIIKENLTLDRIFNYDFPKQIKADMYCFFLPFILKQLGNNSNFPFTRISNKIYEFIIKKNELNQRQKECINKITKSRYHGKDLMDTELIHFATIGYYCDKERFPVNCYTLDGCEKLYDRVSLYKSSLKGILDFVMQNEEESERKKIEKIRSHHFIPGKIICFDRNIKYVKTLSVEKIPITDERVNSFLQRS